VLYHRGVTGRTARRKPSSFRSGLRRRHSDEQLLAELRACAERLGRSPTMHEFAADSRTRVHAQTVVGRFGSWNRAKRLAGLAPRRYATRDELLEQLRALGEELGRTPRGRDLDERRATMPSKSLYWHTFGSLTNALRSAGFDVPRGEERLERALSQGERLARRLGRLPRLADWARAHERDGRLLSEWQVYRLFAGGRGGWPTFQHLLRERLARSGVAVRPDGRVER
jgi:HNH endonuclease